MPIAPVSPQRTASPAPTSGRLQAGASGAAVVELQQLLGTLGLYGAGVDGQFGPQTDAAVRQFQRQHGLAVDGWAGPQTMAALRAAAGRPAQTSPVTPAPAPGLPANAKLVRGATGPAVRELQRLLANAGLYSAASIDGNFGPVTEKAVRAFQQQRGLSVDGWAGPETMAKLRGGATPPPPAPATPTTPLTGPRAARVQTALDFGMSVLGCKYAAVNPFRFGDVLWDGGAHRSINGSDTVWQYPAGTRVFDCSGLVVACFRRAGVDLLGLGLGSSSLIRNNSNGFLQNLTRDQLQAGDLITFPGHVVIYLGNGRCLEASGSGVRVSNVNWAAADSFRRVPLN